MSEFQAVIGLEVHTQLKTRTKIFCRCEIAPGGEANRRICPVCAGLPGALPALNREAVRLGVRAALALGADVQRESAWARKNYFYPDLPKGYQITQHQQPLAIGGAVEIDPPEASARSIALERLHLEEDAGKLLHGRSAQREFGSGLSGVDLNRCGVPLAEIVSRPEIRSPDEAVLVLEELRSILRVTGVSHGDMEQGSLRCDANVSVHRPGEPLGTRVEIKNLNSFRHLRRALAYEIERQSALRADGGSVAHETRLWDEARRCTRAMRSKEEEHDYRYFPEPDLPTLRVDDRLLAEAVTDMPELPRALRERLVREYALEKADAYRLVLNRGYAAFFEELARGVNHPRLAAKWTLMEVTRLLRERGEKITESAIRPGMLAEVLRMLEQGVISTLSAKRVLQACCDGASPAEIVDRLDLRQITDPEEMEALCETVLAASPEEVASYRAGNRALRAHFIGQVMRQSGGRANPVLADRILARQLASRHGPSDGDGRGTP